MLSFFGLYNNEISIKLYSVWCEKVLKMLQFSGRTSTVSHRIKNKHLAAMSEGGSQPKSVALLASWRKCDERQSKAKSVCLVIGADMLPVTVEGEGFKKLVRFLKLKYLMPQRAAEMKHVEKH